MDPQKFNEYEQREAKNFILLDSSKEELTSSNLFIFTDFAVTLRNFFFRIKETSTQITNSQSSQISIRKVWFSCQKRLNGSRQTFRIPSSLLGLSFWKSPACLQRAVDEIYKTVEYYEHLHSVMSGGYSSIGELHSRIQSAC